MTAKEKQTEFIKSYLNPTLKQFGYQTSGQTWWKDKGDFFNVINLQNYSWNSKDSVDFRFNIGIALKVTVKDGQKKKATYNDLTTHLDEGTFLPNRKKRNPKRTSDARTKTPILKRNPRSLFMAAPSAAYGLAKWFR